MKTIILSIVYLLVFVIPGKGISQQNQANNYTNTHPIIEFSKKIKLTDQALKGPIHKSNTSFVLESVEYQGLNENEFISYYKTDFIYQSGNRSETRHSYIWEMGGNWQVDARDVYIYESGRLLSETNQIVIEDEYVNDYRTVFNYQTSGGLTFLFETIDQFWNSDISDWENESRIEYVVSNGVLGGGESSAWGGTEWVLYDRFMLEENNGDLYLTYQDATGTGWINAERQIFENFSISEMYVLFTSEMNIIETGSYLLFAELLPDYTEQIWEGNAWVDVSRQLTDIEYEFGTGQITGKIISGQNFDVEWTPISEVRISYQDGRPREMILYSAEESDTAGLIPVFGEEFEYNDKDQLRYVLQKHITGENFKSSNNTELITVGRLVLQWSGSATSVEDDITPVTFSLGYAYPNPFNPSTVIPLEMGIAGNIMIKVYDMLGRNVATLFNGALPAGSHTIRFDASGLSSGIYLVRFDAPGYQQTRRVTLLK